jgi:hypothetical protein
VSARKEPVLLPTVPADPGKPCTWCDCRVPRPARMPGGMWLYAGHDEDSCAGCDRPAEFVVQLDIPMFDTLARMPVCAVHRGDCEAELAQDFGVRP